MSVAEPQPVEQPSEKGVPEDGSRELLTAPGDEFPQGIRLGLTVLGVIMSLFLAALDMTIVATAIPRITDEFHSIDQVGWYGSAFFLTLAAFQSFWGKLFRYCNLKYTDLATGIVFEVGSLVCAMARDSTALIVGRVVTGIGGAGLYCGTYTIIAFLVPREKRARYTGLVGVSYAIASVAGPLVGGAFTDNISWRWCFYINLPIGGVSMALILLAFTPPASAKPVPAPVSEILLQLDPLGVLAALVALVCFLLVTEWAGVSRAWDSPAVIACLVVSVAMAATFIGIQFWQGERAALVPRILTNRVIFGASCFAFFQNGMNFFFTYYIPIYFQSIDNYSAAESGIYNLPLIFGACLFAIISGFLITINGYYTLYMATGSAACTIAAGLLYTMGMDTPLAKPLGYQMLLGAGQGLAIQVPVIVAQAISKPEDISPATAIILFFQTTGGTICISAGQSAFLNRLLYHLHRIAPEIDANWVVTIGASELRRALGPDQIGPVLQVVYGWVEGYVCAGRWVCWVCVFDELRGAGT
ncbi:MDR family MFS transporter [Aspergillus lucknowensis]|uniref:MFS general substrate transporter n=1 Tax=Aspergillus lucknowensis TaxID=176173 RepID=A0ABR4LHF2_9EURO